MSNIKSCLFTVVFYLSFPICLYSLDDYDPIIIQQENYKEVKDLSKDLTSRSIPELLNILRSDNNYKIRLSAAYIISKKGSVNDIPQLIEIYNELKNQKLKLGYISAHDKNYKVMGYISMAVVNIYIKNLSANRIEQINICVNLIRTHHNKEGGDIYSNGAVEILEMEKFSDEEIKELIKYLNDDNSYIRRIIIISLNNNPNKISLYKLLQLSIEDSDWGNRYWAIKAIEKIGDKGAIPHLQKVLNNKNENEKVRKAAEEAIKSLSK